MEQTYRLSKHSVFNLNYHIVFCPKRRKPVLVDDIANDLKSIIYSTVEEIGCQVETCEIMPDHVHIFIRSLPTISPHRIVKDIKGRSSRILRQKYPQLLKLPALWSRSYYAGSVGYVSESVVKMYIENQKGK